MKIIVGFSRPIKEHVHSKLIRFAEGCTEYSHTYLKVYLSITNQWLVYQAGYGFVHLIEYEHFRRINLVIEEYELEIPEDKFISMLTTANVLLQQKYGFLTVLGIGLMRLLGLRKKPFKDRSKRYICNELVGELLSEYADVKFDKDLETVGPAYINQVVRQIALKI